MRNRTIKQLESMVGANKETGRRLADAMRLALIDFQDETGHEVYDWDTVTYKGHDLIDGEEIHYLEVDVHYRYDSTMTFTVEFEITHLGIGIMLECYETY